MENRMLDKQTLISKILEIELHMFLTVPTLEKSSCQDHPESFKMHRHAQFFPWSVDTISSYLDDLQKAKEIGQNLMTHKYARMDNLIPARSTNPLIKRIIDVQYKWQEEMFSKYPNIMRGARPLSSTSDTYYKTSFETYLSSELETYSDTTLDFLYKDISNKRKNNINMAEEVYEYLVKALGYKSLAEAERKNQHAP